MKHDNKSWNLMIARMQAINNELPKDGKPVSDEELKKITDKVIKTIKR